MQLLSGLFFSLALVLAVVFGGQTLDYTWGPALLALAGALITAGSEAGNLRQRGIVSGIAWTVLAAACGWILWRCWESPVREFARSDALLVAGLAAACLWAVIMPAAGVAVRGVMITLAILGLANLGIGLVQLRDHSFAWPFAYRPAGFPSGLFGHYNHLADFSLVSAVFLAARAIWARDRLGERIIQAAGALAAVACVLMSASRGGALGLGLALTVLIFLGGVIAWRDKSRNRKVAIGLAVVVPLLIALLAPIALKKVQQRRAGEGSSLAQAADDRFRLTFIGAAMEISTQQSWAGSGSRSFGWKKNAAWQPEDDGKTDRFNDDFVHNELLQAAVDYGWIGAILIVAAALAVGLGGVAGLAGRGDADAATRGALDAACCGGLAAMVGTLAHSNFSFVTHTLPGAVYLGLAFGLALPKRSEPAGDRPGSRSAGVAACLLMIPMALLLGYAGWQGTRTYRILWPAFFGRDALAVTSPEVAVERVQRAMELWPGAELAGRGGHLGRQAGGRPGLLPTDQEIWWTQATELYATAGELNPFDPEWPVNRAVLLSRLGRDDEAEREFERAIPLQGGMERNFWARYHLAAHLYRRWYQVWVGERRAGEALYQFHRARELLRQASEQGDFGHIGKEARDLVAGLEETIRFLEGARVQAEPPR